MTKQNPPEGQLGRAGKIDKGIELPTSTTRPNQNPARPAPPMMAARLDYAARGWWTFPTPADGSKKSLLWASEENDFSRWGATRDPKIIAREFRSRRLRDQNVGIVTGAPSGIFVIETDTAEHGEGIDGEAALRKIEKQYGPLPKTRTAVSPSGSVHRYFQHPGDGIKVKSFADVFRMNSGVDCKGDGGMVIGVPSIRPPMPAQNGKPAKVGGVYRWLRKGRIAEAPQWLLEFVIEPPREARTTSRTSTHAERPGNVALIRAALAQIPAYCHYDDWMTVGAALCHEFGGSDLGYELFESWSTSVPEYAYAAGACRAKWVQFELYYRQITIGSLFFLAEEKSPRWRAVYEARRMAETYAFMGKVRAS